MKKGSNQDSRSKTKMKTRKKGSQDSRRSKTTLEENTTGKIGAIEVSQEVSEEGIKNLKSNETPKVNSDKINPKKDFVENKIRQEQNTRLTLKKNPTKTPFVWENYLNNNSFTEWLVSSIVPKKLKKQVTYVFKCMDNLTTYEDLVYNLNYLTPETIISLFHTKGGFIQNMDGVICTTFIPAVIQHTKENIAQPELRAHTEFAYNTLQNLMNSNKYREAKANFTKALEQTSLIETESRNHVDASTITSKSSNLTLTSEELNE